MLGAPSWVAGWVGRFLCAWINEARPRLAVRTRAVARSGRRHPLHRPECTVTARADVREADVSQRRTQESAHGPSHASTILQLPVTSSGTT